MSADALRTLLDAPPPDVRVQQSLDGIHIQLPPPLRLDALLAALGWLVAMLAVPAATFALLAGLAAQQPGTSAGLAPVLSFLVLLPCVFLALPRVGRALGTTRAQIQIDLGPHALRLGDVQVPFSDVTHISPDGTEPSLFTADGHQYAILADHPDEVRRWLAQVLRAVHATRRGGSAQDVPRVLQQLQGRDAETR